MSMFFRVSSQGVELLKDEMNDPGNIMHAMDWEAATRSGLVSNEIKTKKRKTHRCHYVLLHIACIRGCIDTYTCTCTDPKDTV